MKVILPWEASPKSTTVTRINLVPYPYLVSNIIGGANHMLSLEEIIMRLEAAYEDKDWDAVDLLLQDLRAAEEDIDQWSENWGD
jgi:hypothetical protein